jgi:hypothetical protein
MRHEFIKGHKWKTHCRVVIHTVKLFQNYLACYAAEFGPCLLTFERNVLPPYSRSESKRSKQAASLRSLLIEWLTLSKLQIYQTIYHKIPEDYSSKSVLREPKIIKINFEIHINKNKTRVLIPSILITR